MQRFAVMKQMYSTASSTKMWACITSVRESCYLGGRQHLHSLRLDWAETVNTLQSALQEVHQIPPLHSWDLTRFTPRWLHHKNVFVHQVLSRFEENVSKTRYLLFKLLNSFWIWCPQHRFCKSLHSVLTVYAASQRFWSRACKSQQGKMSCDPRVRRGKETLLCAKCKD